MDQIIDYAMPLINIERMAKETHALCLQKKYVEAKEVAIHMMSEARILSTVLTIMDEREQERK